MGAWSTRAWFVLIGLVAAAGLCALAGPALADPWGTGTQDTGDHPDADPHTFCFHSSVRSDARANIESAEWNALDPTSVNVDFNSTCDLKGRTETDVVWRQADLPNRRDQGETRCEDYDGQYCDQFYSAIDMSRAAVGDLDEIDETMTACHELGHTVGLTHGGSSTDCMAVRGETPPTAMQFRRYGPHHRDHLDRWFD